MNTICPGLETDVPVDTGPPPAIPTADTLVEGDLVITEVMHNPSFGSPAQPQSEYFEIYNTLDHQVDLQGLIVSIDGNAANPLTQNYVIEPNSFALARRVAGCNGNGYPLNIAPCDFVWGHTDLNNDGSSLILANASGIIDAVYLNGLSQDDYALELHGPILNGPDPHLANDDPSEWCSADSADMIGFSNDRGTPVLDNGLCYGSAPSGDTGDTGGSTSPVDTAPQPPPPPPVLGVLDLGPGDLVLTEVMFDPSYALSGNAQAASEYIEVYNLSGFEVDLTGLELGINGGTIDLDGSYTVDAGELAVLRRQAGCNGNGYALSVAPCHLEWAGINPSPELSNNGSFVSIEAGGTVIDSIDLTGLGADGVSVQLALSSMIGLNPSGANDDPGNWCETPSGLFIGNSTDLGTPFAGNVPCTTAAPVDTGDTDVTPTDTAPPQWGIDDLSPGDLLISEVMFDPDFALSGSAQSASEYIEIYNPTAHAIDLTGLELGLNGGTTPFDTTFVVGPGEIALARRVSGCNGNGYDLAMAPCDLEWGSYLPTNPVVDLSNNGSELTLQVGNLVIDSIDLTGLVNDGISLQLTVESLTGATPSVANDDVGNWCETPAWQVIGTTGDRGTPSASNVSCAATGPLVDTAVVETGATDSDTVPVFDSDAILTSDDLVFGDLIFTEIMMDPDQCTDGQGEYVELYNASGHEVNLAGLKFADNTTTITIVPPIPGQTDIMVGVGEHFIGVRTAPGTPYSACYANVQAKFAFGGLLLNNGSEAVQVMTPAYGLIDQAAFSSSTTAYAWSLDPSVTDAVLNDVDTNWCLAPDLIPLGFDWGSPALPNPSCAP